MATYTGKKLSFTQNGDTFILDPVSVFEYEDTEHFPATGSSGKIYISLDTNVIYRWDETEQDYVPVSSSGGGGSCVRINFSLAISDWSVVTGGYQAAVTSPKLLSASEEIITYDSTIESRLTANITVEKDAANNAVIFKTKSLPNGVISGRILSFSSNAVGTMQTVFEDVPFTILTTDWSDPAQGDDPAYYQYYLSNQRITEQSGIWVFYDGTYNENAQAPIMTNPDDGRIEFSTETKPTGTITGFVRFVDSINGTIPPERGGTGATTLAEACENIGAVPLTQKGAANGVATLDGSGLIPSNQLPSYVDDVLEFASLSEFPQAGEIGKIYVAIDTNKSYRWSGSTYVELSAYALATQAAAGLMSAQDKTKLDGIATGATANVVSDSLSDTSTTNALSAAKGKALNDELTSANTAISSINEKIISTTPTYNSLNDLESALLTKADSLPSGAMASINFFGNFPKTGDFPATRLWQGTMSKYSADWFAVNIVGNDGLQITMGYDNGTWKIVNTNQAIATLNSNLNPFLNTKSWNDGTKPTLDNGSHYGTGCYYFKVGCFVYIVISAEFSSAPSNALLFTLPSGYRPVGTAEIPVSGGGSYNAKAQCQINSSGGVRVTSVDKWVIGSGMFLVGG